MEEPLNDRNFPPPSPTTPKARETLTVGEISLFHFSTPIMEGEPFFKNPLPPKYLRLSPKPRIAWEVV